MRQVRDSSRGTRRSTGVLVVLLVLALLLGAGGALCAAGVLQLPWPAEERASNPAEPAPESGAELPVSIAGPEGSEELATTVVSAPHPTSAEPPYDWDAELAPNYVLDCGPSQVRTASLPEGAYAQYGELDGLGRATGVVAVLAHEQVVEASERGRLDMSDVRPSGWGHNERVEVALPNGGTYHGYFWNRSHLLADSLGGEASARNIVCGTRMQNVGANDGEGGMAWCEGIARSWLWSHEEGTLIFSAVPWYEGDELVPRAVVMDLLSSDGSVDLHTVVYNAALGYEIDYATGEFWPA